MQFFFVTEKRFFSRWGGVFSAPPLQLFWVFCYALYILIPRWITAEFPPSLLPCKLGGITLLVVYAPTPSPPAPLRTETIGCPTQLVDNQYFVDEGTDRGKAFLRLITGRTSIPVIDAERKTFPLTPLRLPYNPNKRQSDTGICSVDGYGFVLTDETELHFIAYRLGW